MPKEDRVSPPVQGFTVHEDNPGGFEIQIRVLYRKENSPSLDEIQTSLTSVYAKAFAEIDKRLGK